MLRACFLHIVLSAGAALLWVHVTYTIYLWLLGATEFHAGLHTIGAIFFNPVMFIYEALRVPWDFPISGQSASYAYYTLMTVLLWNLPAGPHSFRRVATVYGGHTVLNLLTTLPYVVIVWNIVPGLGRFYLRNDLVALQTLGRREPWLLMGLMLCLTAWHAAAIGRLAFLWSRQRRIENASA